MVGSLIIALLQMYLPVKEYWKLVKICKSYCHEFGVSLFWNTMYSVRGLFLQVKLHLVLSVGLYFSNEYVLWKNNQLDWDVQSGGGLGVLKERCIRWGFRSPHRKGQFFSFLGGMMQHNETHMETVQKWLNQLSCCLGWWVR